MQELPQKEEENTGEYSTAESAEKSTEETPAGAQKASTKAKQGREFKESFEYQQGTGDMYRTYYACQR